jgi:plastocyanin
MRRRLALILPLALVAASATAFGLMNAGASTSPALVPKAVVKIVPMASCTSGTLFCYKPAAISVASGTRVVFKNNTTVIHTVTRCTMPACPVSGGTGTDTGFGSPGTIAAGGTYKFVFHGKGTYVYYCQIHGYSIMHGTITVT